MSNDESRIPFNRIVAFIGPYVSVASGALASWLLVHVHALGLFHIQQDGLSTAIGQGSIFLVTAVLAWAGQSKWLKGHHIMLEQAASTAAAFPGAPTFAGEVASGADLPPAPTDVHAEPADVERLQQASGAIAAPAVVAGNGAALTPSAVGGEVLVPDDQEFASPYLGVEGDDYEQAEGSATPDAPEDL